jgi:hypothetical protein
VELKQQRESHYYNGYLKKLTNKTNMKSKEEIEQLAKQLCNIPIDLVIDEEERYYKNLDKYDGIIQGYTQCQKDMLKILQEEIKKAFMHGQVNAQMMEIGLERNEVEDYTNSRMLSFTNIKKTNE